MHTECGHWSLEIHIDNKHIYLPDIWCKCLLAWCWPRAYNIVDNLEWLKPIAVSKMSAATKRTENI